MQEALETIVDFASKWLTVYAAIYGIIAAAGLVILIVIVVNELRDK